MTQFIKDPDAVLDWLFKWEDWLQDGETITSHTITVDAGITLDSSSIIDTNTNVQVWLSGGDFPTSYNVACEITTSEGRTDERTFLLKMIER